MDLSLLIQIVGGAILSGFCGIFSYSMRRNVRQTDDALKELQGDLHEAQLESSSAKMSSQSLDCTLPRTM